MNLFQSWADTVLMLILAIAYIITFFVQRTTIKRLQNQIDAIEKTNRAAAALTEIQSSHIDTYKKMVDINEIEEYAEMRAKKVFMDIVSNDGEFKDLVKKSADEVINRYLMDIGIEQARFIKFTFTKILKFDSTSQEAIIEKYLPESKDFILHLFGLLDEKADTQKNQNQ